MPKCHKKTNQKLAKVTNELNRHTHDVCVYENTWKCGELELFFSPIRRRIKK